MNKDIKNCKEELFSQEKIRDSLDKNIQILTSKNINLENKMDKVKIGANANNLDNINAIR